VAEEGPAAHPNFARIPALADPPDSYEATKQAEQAGRFESTGEGWTPMTDGPVTRDYKLVPDRDLNGAGLVYFANYPMFLDICERDVLASARVPLTDDLIDRRTLVRRRSAYLNNASSRDTLRIEIEPWLRASDAGLHLHVNGRMFRRSDDRLMMVATARKIVPAAALGDRSARVASGTVPGDRNGDSPHGRQRRPIRPPHGAGGPHRQRARVVRLRGLRLLRERHRPAVLPAIEPDGPATARVRRVRARLRRAPIGSLVLGVVGDRIGRRALLTVSIALMGVRHAAHRPAPDLRADRARGTDPARPPARGPGFLAGRRVHRVDGLHDRAGVARVARPGQQLHRRRTTLGFILGSGPRGS
jgi:hypothetical protein